MSHMDTPFCALIHKVQSDSGFLWPCQVHNESCMHTYNKDVELDKMRD